MTINHPHGQIYAFPYLTPKMSRVVQRGQAHAARTGGNLHERRPRRGTRRRPRRPAERRMGRVRPLRRPLAVRGAPVPETPGARLHRARRRAARRVPGGLPGPAAQVPAAVRRERAAGPVHRGLVPGAVRRAAGGCAARRGVHGPARSRQAHVPGWDRVGHGRLHAGHRAGAGRGPAARGRGRASPCRGLSPAARPPRRRAAPRTAPRTPGTGAPSYVSAARAGQSGVHPGYRRGR